MAMPRQPGNEWKDMRSATDFRWIAVLAAVVAALLVTTSLVVSSGYRYVAAVHRIEQLAQTLEGVAELSSTTGGAQPDAKRRVDAARARLGAERAEAQRHLEATQRATATLGVLVALFVGLACTTLLRAARTRRRLETDLAERSNHDPLTGLPNQRFFAEWLAYAIAHARRERGHVGVLFIDIDGRGAVSEFHGERAADALLVEIARRFRAASREGDLLARLGPTEFALATPNARNGRQLALLAQRLRDQLNEGSQPPLADTPIGASIGIAFFPEDADDSAGIMAAANAAMYAARRAGRNHVAFNALAA